jgi:hypothetical protein
MTVLANQRCPVHYQGTGVYWAAKFGVQYETHQTLISYLDDDPESVFDTYQAVCCETVPRVAQLNLGRLSEKGAHFC